MKPVIGITADVVPTPESEYAPAKLQLNWNYAQCVADAGGIPVIIPPQADPDQILDVVDGILIPGGNDIDASNWGEENHPEVKPIEESRFNIEKELMLRAGRDLPVLGICYGCQLINVVRGGSLIQHLPDVVGHNENSGGTMQDYSISESSKLGSIVAQGKVQGKSYHHQAVKEVGEGMKVVARGDDGTVEAIEAEDRPWMVGVQWHPERTADDPATQRLFREFIEAARAYREKRSTLTSVV
jgi:putative glutamine amidotransferase